jgi:LysM repeat protein
MRIDNVLTNRRLFRKSYLIEFYTNNKNVPQDVFTFSVPPENEELTYSQRKTETKTFSGLQVEDYGADAVNITLSGSTINQSIKRIYRPDRNDKWLSGEDEIYHFRDLIMKHKDLDVLKLPENKHAKIYIYDLSKFTGLRTSTISNYWQAFPGEFKIRRSSDKPFTYKYTFNFTGVPISDGEERIARVIPPGINSLAIIKNILNAIKAVLDFLLFIEALVDDALEFVNQIAELLNILGAVKTRSIRMVTNIMGATGTSMIMLIDGVTNVSAGVRSILQRDITTNQKALSIGIDLQNATNRLSRTIQSMTAESRSVLEADSFMVPQRALRQSSMENDEFKDAINLSFNQLENLAHELSVYAKSTDIPDISEGNKDPITGIPEIILSYGSSSIMVKSTDNFETLATEYLGSPGRAIEIAAYNGVASIDDIKPGDVLKIPITTQTMKMANNLIYGRREDIDNYGRDILLTEDGYILTSNRGDYKLSTGAQNLTQAVLLRLRENRARRIRLAVYGIRNNISDPNAGVVYILSTVNQTVSDDPRVANVDDIWFRANGDHLEIKVTYHDINNAKSITSGRV